VVFKDGEAPAPEVDGCGNPATLIWATGTIENEQFIATSWREEPNPAWTE
jgi:hypothetical protein